MEEPCYYRVSVKGVAFDAQGRVLLAREDNGAWEMIGGGLEHGEDPIEGLKREIYEETGLEAVRISDQPAYFITSPRRGKAGYMANVIYEIELASLNFVASEECQELRYFSLEDMQTVELFPNVQKLYEILSAQQGA